MRAYRTTLLLSGFVLLGWLWDFSLGGGAVHSAAWLLALVLVGGISALSARAKLRRPAETRDQPSAITPTVETETRSGHQVRLARPDEYAELIEVEIAADRLFPLAGYGETPGPASAQDLADAAATLVVDDPPVGYARLGIVDGHAHLEGLSVRPKFMRQGRGAALVLAAVQWAAEQGFDRISLTTFAEVPWNGPFYRRLGFVELTELTPGLAAARAAEQAIGLDAMGRRIAMVRPIERLEP